MYIESLEKLINTFRSLPGVGYKTAQRYAYSILNRDDECAKTFAQSILDAKQKIKFCNECGNFSETEVCESCLKKNKDIICVVKEPKDVIAMEKVYLQKKHALSRIDHFAAGMWKDNTFKRHDPNDF